MIEYLGDHRIQATQAPLKIRRLITQSGVYLRLASHVVLIVLLSACSLLANRTPSHDTPSNQHLRLRQPEELEPVAMKDGTRLQVVASTSIIADVVANIGGEMLELAVLIPPGIDPHAYQPTPGDLQALYQADLVLLNGFDLEAGLNKLLRPVSTNIPIISLSEGLEARTLPQEPSTSDEHGERLDPHVWFDPALVSHWVDRIEIALTHLDPDHATDFRDRANHYRGELVALDDWIQVQISSIPISQRKLVLDHLVMGYFADRYGFEIISALVPAFSSAAETSARELASLDTVIRSEGVPAIFIGVDTNPRLAKQLARDLGVAVVQLYTGSLSEAGRSASTYLDMMQYNVLALRQALGEEG